MPVPEVPPPRPLRVDAERNRRRILETAAVVFAERGLDVSLDEIAAAAGVGVGTVYRRFPDKDALIDALFEDKIRAAEALARGALEVADPWEAFSGFMRGMCRLQADDRGFKDALLSVDRGRDRVARARDTIAPLAIQLLRRAQEGGVVRADLGEYDVPLMHFAVGFVAEKTDAVAPGYWERLLNILLDGIRAEREETTPMPVEPLKRAAFVEALASGSRVRRTSARHYTS
jgi:AcrR family transcriptional regulator